MEELFITKIQINQVRNILDFTIPLSDSKRQNLIITGKNGSGKTSLLYELQIFLDNIRTGQIGALATQENNWNVLRARMKELEKGNTSKENLSTFRNQMKSTSDWLERFGGTRITFSHADIVNRYLEGDFILAYFSAKRNSSFRIPSGITKVNLLKSYAISQNASSEFIQYIVNLKADRSFAKDDGDEASVGIIDRWFANFEMSLRYLFDDSNLELKFDRSSYNFNIVETNKQPYSLDKMSDGYSAVSNIVTELILRMEHKRRTNYDVEGIVLIDEIETHLHVALQKKILPYLTSFFPNIQFIVTTHSPFVLSSIENAIICDLETRSVIPDLSGYSYDTLIESYFDSDKYSHELTKRINEYEVLTAKPNLTAEQVDRLNFLKKYLADIPKYLNDELAVKLQQIKLNNLSKRNDL